METQYLIDTNIPLEIILAQNNAMNSADILNNLGNLYITDFSLKSLFLVAYRKHIELEKLEVFISLLLKKCKVIQITNEELVDIYAITIKKNLDFDDAHLYYLAKKNKMKIITYDKHLLKYKSVSINGNLLLG